MSGTTDERLRDAILEQATEWFARHRASAELPPGEQAAFVAWLRQSPLHVQEYLALQQLAADLPAALGGRDAETERSNIDTIGARSNVIPFRVTRSVASGTPRKGRSVQVRALLALAVALIITVLSYWLAVGVSRPLQQPRVISVPHGEQRTVQLPDGSVMHLNANSRVTVRYSDVERLVELEEGQALFDVTHDPRRPFWVRAGSTQVIAVGTQFDVYRRGDERVTVTVVQGRVDVVSHQGFDDPQRATKKSRPLLVTAGEQVQIGPAVIPRVEAVDVHLATAWIHREIAFDRRPLGEIADEINRYAPVPIGIEDESLRNLPVSGVLDAYDTESLLLFLSQYGTVEVGKHAILVHRRAKTSASPSTTASK